MRFLLGLYIVVLGGLFLGCQPVSEQGSTAPMRLVTDDYGREVLLPKKPQKILSLAPSVTEILFEVCDTQDIVGVTYVCDYPEAALSKPRIKNYPILDLEGIVQLAPDLIVSYDGMLQGEDVHRLEKLGYPVYMLKYGTLEEMTKSLKRFYPLVADSLRSMERLKKFSSDLNEFRMEDRNETFLGVVSMDPLYVFGNGCFLEDIMSYCGTANVLNGSEPYPNLSREELQELSPDVVLLGHDGADSSVMRKLYPEFFEKEGGQDLRVIYLDGNLIARPTLRATDCIKELKQKL